LRVLTFADYRTRTTVGAPIKAEQAPPPARVENAH
jgi:hypothetical protein